ncbi:GntR family transcriptional regulator [Zhihengliuella salsuginis]|uniref:Transcriptional regulator n=1 Tax=Zhihengliuella salsuginis TaxID=578222 RepID=A0ABQ3GBZ1_9MICC|nr:GntR family transcriptional regulator [Zhihengliuella salsuginis]GHC99956.1 transcriptional regulator [Zhihengliuella salsuginis]
MEWAGQAKAPVVGRVQRSSTVDLIAIELRNAIYNGLIKPGAPLREVEIAGQLGVSRGPFREAAQRLVQEGLLHASPGQGLRTVAIGVDDLEDLYRARLAVESAAIRRLVAQFDGAARAAALSGAAEILARLRDLADRDDTDAVARAIGDTDLDFHFEVVRAAGAPRLGRYMSTLVIETRIASLSHPAGYVVRTDTFDTHRRRLDLILAGEAEEAVEELSGHFDETMERLRGQPSAGVQTTTVDRVEGTYAIEPIRI